MARIRHQDLHDEARRLRADVAASLRKGQLRKARALYHALELLEPDDARWSCLVADLDSRLGDRAGEIAALVRAAERHAAAGSLLRAIVLCKRILDLDPRHVAVQARLASLAAAGSVLPLLPPHLGEATAASGAPIARSVLTQVPLDDLPEERAAIAPGAWSIPHVPLFGDLGAAAFERLVRALRPLHLREDATLFREGDPGDALYVVVEGGVVPSHGRPPRRGLAVLEAGGFFGEITLISDQPRAATLRAVVDSTLLTLDAETTRSLIREEPGLAVVFLRFLRKQLVGRLAREAAPLRTIDAAGLARIASRFRFLTPESDAVLASEGETVRRLLLLLGGRFEVSARGSAPTRTWLDAGQLVGARELLSGEPAPATVTARGPGLALALEGAAFDELAAAQPALSEGLRALADDEGRGVVLV